MTTFPSRAAALGFLKPDKYAAIERERRWQCAALPDLPARQTARITDLYIAGSHLRLRTVDGRPHGPLIHKLAKKADLAADHRLITTIYLTPEEHALLAGLPGAPLAKTRHTYAAAGTDISLDVFEGPLAGLFLAEAEFASDEAMAAFAPPAFLGPEVTHDARYTGARLAHDGLPD